MQRVSRDSLHDDPTQKDAPFVLIVISRGNPLRAAAGCAGFRAHPVRCSSLRSAPAPLRFPLEGEGLRKHKGRPLCVNCHLQGESNPRCRDENPVS